MLKRILTLVISLCTLLLFSCTNMESGTGEEETPEEYNVTFTDSVGNLVTLNKKPEKVAVLFSSFADIWVSAGGRIDITVGESVERGFAEEGVLLVDESAGHTTIDTETLIMASPDLVIGTADYESNADACNLCRDAGIPAALFRVESLDDYLSMLKILCEITECEENYVKYGEEVKKEADEIIFSVPEREKQPRILFVRAGSGARSTKAKTAEDNFVCEMLKELKTENIAEKARVLLDGLSLEEIVSADPDYIFVSFMGKEEESRAYFDSLISGEGWRSLTAVKKGRVVYLPKELFHYKPNSRWATAYKTLYNELYGE